MSSSKRAFAREQQGPDVCEEWAAPKRQIVATTESKNGLLTGRPLLIWIVSILLFALASNLAVTAFVTHERTVYFWDWRGYWHRAQTTTAAVERGLGIREEAPEVRRAQPVQPNTVDEPNADPFVIRAMKRLVDSVWNDTYNLVAVLPLLPWTLLFGAERLPYVLSILNLYAMPAVILLCVFCYRYPLRLDALNDHWRIWVPLALIAGLPLFWAPIVRGMVDVATLACNLFVLLIYFSRPLKELRWPALVSIGLLLALGVVLRRWNAYWAVSFLVVIGLDGLVGFVRSQERSLAHLLAHLRPSFIAGAAALAFLVVGAGPLSITMATTDYADIYEAFNFEDGFFPVLAALGRDIGYFWLGLFALSAATLLWASETRRLALILTGQCVLIVVLFTRTQSLNVHHYYLLQAGGLIICSLFILRMMARWSGAWSRGVVVGAMLATVGLVDLSIFVPRAAPLHALLEPLVPRDIYYPLVRHDVAELNRLYATLDELLDGTEDQADQFYVLSATYELNDTHFIATSIPSPFKFASGDRLLRSHLVDKRDGFPQRLLDAEVVILGSPIGGKGEFAQVLLEPARLIQDGVGLGRAFVELPYEFHLDNEVTARLFKRVRTFTPAEIQALSEHLRRLYPDYPYVYQPNYDER